jgi:hypothetical protein
VDGPLDAQRLLRGRDARALARVLVLADRLPDAPQDGAGPLVAALARWGADLRVTVLAGAPGGAPGWLGARGVEAAAPAEPAAWVVARPGHYDVVVDAGAGSALAEAAHRAQPWAGRVAVVPEHTAAEAAGAPRGAPLPRAAAGRRARMVAALAEAHAVLVDGAHGRALAAALAPAARAHTLDAAGDGLARALADVGVPPPRPLPGPVVSCAAP